MKKCTKCGEVKELSKFHKDASKALGVSGWCKKCVNKNVRDYLHTKEGLITQIYTHQKSSSKRRGHPSPSYSKNELKKWIYSQDNFEILFYTWEKSGFKREFSPSIDRINDELPYSMDNISLTYWHNNKHKEHIRRKNGLTSITKPVIGMNKKTNEVVRFLSGKIASRQLSISYESIMACCSMATVMGKNGKKYRHKSAGGYVWMYE